MFGSGRRSKLKTLSVYAPKFESDLDLVLESIHTSIKYIFAKASVKGIENAEAQLRENLPTHCHNEPYIFTEPDILFGYAQICFESGAKNIAKQETRAVLEGTVQKIVGLWLVAKALAAPELDNLNKRNPSLENMTHANPVIAVRMQEKIKAFLKLASSSQT